MAAEAAQEQAVSTEEPRTEPTGPGYEDLGVPKAQVARWQELGFGPFEAALAHADGFTPASAPGVRHLLAETAERWAAVGLASAEGLAWHRAGFPPAEARRLLDAGVSLEEAWTARTVSRLRRRRPPSARPSAAPPSAA
jgi:hypothetical protein